MVDLGDTWEWNGTAWAQIAGAGLSPRSGAASAYYPELSGVVVSGGNVSGVISDETWLWNGTVWQSVQMAEITPHWMHGMSYDVAGNRLVVSGGGPGGTGRYADSWELSTAISIETQPQPLSTYLGATASFSVATGGPVSGYQWRKNGAALVNGGRVSGATSAMLTISSVLESDEGTYDCVVSSDCRSVVSGSALLSVIVCPSDFNLDGTVDFFDYLDFVAAFAGNEPAADFNHDFSIDFFDYLDFVSAFAAGC